jgi:hypothetical protein
MLAGVTGVMDCIKAFSETDFTEDLKTFDVPIGASALVSSTIIKNATLKVYPSAPHGLTNTHKDQLNTALEVCAAGPNCRRYRPATNGVTKLAGLHWRPRAWRGAGCRGYGPQPAQLRDAVLEGVTLAGNQIAGEHGEIGLRGVGQISGAPNCRAGHEVPDVKIAEVDDGVDDAEAIQTGG